MAKSIILLIITAGLLLGACGGSGVQRLQASDNGRTVELQVGERLEIVLEGNPTTGFSWEQTGGEAAILRPQAEPGYTPSSGMVGAGGTFVFSFDSIAPGETSLELIYRRPFEPDLPPLETFVVTVVVR